MLDGKKPVSAVILFAVLAVLFMGARVKWGKTEQSAGMQSERLSYAMRGPHLVGTCQLVVRSETPLEISLWYPALDDHNSEVETRYPYEIKMGAPFGTLSIASYAGQAIQEAPQDLSLGPYPLVLLSPGFSIGSSAYAWLAEHLASYGLVVISPEHHEQLDPGNELWRATIRRPQDILTVLEYVDQQVLPSGEFSGLIDAERVAVAGHSYGGYTALAAGGARLDTASFTGQCESAFAAEGPLTFLCEQLFPHLQDMAILAGLESVPEGLWPGWADPRVDAIVPMAGDAFFFGQAGLAEIHVPVLAIGGTKDSDSPFQWGTQPAYADSSSLKKVKIGLLDAEHMIFSGPCESTPFLLKFFSGEFCSDPGWDRLYAHQLIRHFTTAFLLGELKGDASAAAMLAPEQVDFPEVDYEAQGYEPLVGDVRP